MAQVLSQEEVDALLSAVNESSDANHDDDMFMRLLMTAF